MLSSTQLCSINSVAGDPVSLDERITNRRRDRVTLSEKRQHRERHSLHGASHAQIYDYTKMSHQVWFIRDVWQFWLFIHILNSPFLPSSPETLFSVEITYVVGLVAKICVCKKSNLDHNQLDTFIFTKSLVFIPLSTPPTLPSPRKASVIKHTRWVHNLRNP